MRRSDCNDEIEKISTSKNTTPKKQNNERNTRSPIKTPRSVKKFPTTNKIQTKLFKNNKEKEDAKEIQIINARKQIEIVFTTKKTQEENNEVKRFNIQEEEKESNELSKNKPLNIPPKTNLYKENQLGRVKNEIDNLDITETEEINDDTMIYNKNKKKKDWRSWSLNEKLLFYEAIANGGNYSSLQKLFKNMNDKIGTKSTEKIRDYYYRALKNVNKLLKSVGDNEINRKNRDEVLLALNCYGKMITSSNSKNSNKLDAMKKLNKHPRLFKKAALTLKKLIQTKIKLMRTKKISGGNQALINKNNKVKTITKNVIRKDNKIYNNMSNLPNLPIKIIDPDICRKLPYEKFLLRLIPRDHDSYFKMIEANYNSRLELSVNYNKTLRNILEVLSEKWKSIPKNYSDLCIYLCPLPELWISKDNIFFSLNGNFTYIIVDDTKAFDIGDIYTGYGRPQTNILFMQYQWNGDPHMNDSDVLKHDVKEKSKEHVDESEIKMKDDEEEENDDDLDDFMKDISPIDTDEEKDKSCMPFEQEFDEFDPLEYLGVYCKKKKEKDSSSSDDDYENEQNNDNEVVIKENMERKMHVSLAVPASNTEECNNLQERLQYFERKNIENDAQNNEIDYSNYLSQSEASGYLNFSNLGSKLKSNLNSNNNENKSIGYTFNKEKKVTGFNQGNTTINQSPKKAKRLAFIQNVTPSETKVKANISSATNIVPITSNTAQDNNHPSSDTLKLSNPPTSSVIKNLTHSFQNVNTSNDAKRNDDVNNFNLNNDNNSNIFNIPNLFDHQENSMNFRTNLLNNDNMFYSNNFNSNNFHSILNRGNICEDSMMKRINNAANPINKLTTQMENIIHNNMLVIAEEEKETSDIQQLKKKTQRKKTKDTNKTVDKSDKVSQKSTKKPRKRSNPAQLDEVLDHETKSTKTKKSQSQSQNLNYQNTNPCIINQNNYFNNIPYGKMNYGVQMNNNNINLEIPDPNKFISEKQENKTFSFKNMNQGYNMMDQNQVMMMNTHRMHHPYMYYPPLIMNDYHPNPHPNTYMNIGIPRNNIQNNEYRKPK